MGTRMHKALACVSFSLLLASVQIAGQLTLPIDWAQVPLLGSTTSKNLTASCTCDLNLFVCDVGCCCDPYCEDPVTNSTIFLKGCSPQGPPDQTLTYCVADSFVNQVNLPSDSNFYSVLAEETDDKFFTQLLCIVDSSNPALGDQYPDPPAGDVNSNQALTPGPLATIIPTRPDIYLYNTPVHINRGGVRLPLTVPYPALSEDCSYKTTVGFLNNFPASQKDIFSTCSVDTYDASVNATKLQQLCSSTGVLSPSYYTSMGYYWIPSAGSPNTMDEAQVMSQDAFGALTLLPGNTVAEFMNQTCRNAVRFINITISYTWNELSNDPNGQGFVYRMSVSVVVSDINQFDTNFKQSSRVNFVLYQPTETRILQPFSGNPGYQIGYDVLAGALAVEDATTDSKRAVQRFTLGLPLPAASSDGTCSPTASKAVQFGTNSTVTCTIALQAADLAAFCTNRTTSPQLYLQVLMGQVFNNSVDGTLYVGIWGNSNNSFIAEWIPVQVSNNLGNRPFSNLVYSASDRSCTAVVVGFDLEILTGVAFASNNLQKKVLFANLYFRTSTWTFSPDRALTDLQQFTMTSTVRFIELEQTRQTGINRPAPPLLTPLPYEIFYPFVTGGASSSRHLGTGTAVVMLVSALLATLLGLRQLA